MGRGKGRQAWDGVSVMCVTVNKDVLDEHSHVCDVRIVRSWQSWGPKGVYNPSPWLRFHVCLQDRSLCSLGEAKGMQEGQ